MSSCFGNIFHVFLLFFSTVFKLYENLHICLGTVSNIHARNICTECNWCNHIFQRFYCTLLDTPNTHPHRISKNLIFWILTGDFIITYTIECWRFRLSCLWVLFKQFLFKKAWNTWQFLPAIVAGNLPSALVLLL